jgi:hypothetical protein
VTLLEDWMEARLGLGDHRSAVGELRELTKLHPLRERLWLHLMLAQYRCGNSGAALTVFNEARATLADQLGIEPGPDLTRLQAAVLAHDPALLVESCVSPSETIRIRTPVTPRELPADIDDLVGRDLELVTISAAAHRLAPTVALHGGGGIGKSALAVHAAHRLQELYPDGQLHVDLHGSHPELAPSDPIDVLHRLLRTLGSAEPPPVGLTEAAARFRTLVADRRMILLLDDARDEAQVRPLLPGTADTLVIVTSRRILAALNPVTQMDVGPLQPGPAIEVLRRLSAGARCLSGHQHLDQLASPCEGSPLALRIVAARLASRPGRSPDALIAQLSDERTRLDALHYEPLSVRASLSTSHRQLTCGRRLFGLLGALRLSSIGSGVAAAALGLPTTEAEQALDELVAERLVHQVGDDRYRVPGLVRLYAAEVNTTDPDEPLQRVLAWYLQATGEAVEVACRTHNCPPGSSAGAGYRRTRAALAWLRAEHANLHALTERAARSAPVVAASVAPLLKALYPYLSRHGRAHELAALGQMAFGAFHQVSRSLGAADQATAIGCERPVGHTA